MGSILHSRNRRRLGLLAACAWIAGAGGAGAEGAAGQVTAVVGEAVADGDRPLAQASRVPERSGLATGVDGQCALIVDDDALVEVCENTALHLERDGRVRVVRLDAGAIRLVAEPRFETQRIEVRTPVAVATLMGTIVHVEVDPVTGRTTITSDESQVRVRSADPSIRGETTVSARERLTVERGAAPPARAVRVAEEQIGHLPGCRVDLRRRALDEQRDTWQLSLLDRLAGADGAGGGLPDGPRAGESDGGPLPPPGDDLAADQDVCNALDCSEMESPARLDPQVQLLIDGF